MATEQTETININGKTYELVPFFDHQDQNWLLALRQVTYKVGE